MDVLRFLTDTHVDKQVTIQLRQRGIDIVRCEEVGLATADDETILIFAAREQRILITFDQGFRDRSFTWMGLGKQHAGIFLCKQHLQGLGMGTIVKQCLLYHELVVTGAGTPDDFFNEVIYLE